MQKTKIEWCINLDGTQGYSWNLIKGYCPNDCPYCYAHRLYNRFGWNKILRFDFPELYRLDKIKKPSRIFVGSMIDMYHPDIPRSWTERIIEYSKQFPQHTFITLTKFPDNLDYFIFPDNWWIGITVDGSDIEYKLHLIDYYMADKNKRFISFEPILSAAITQVGIKYMDWIIIGGKSPGPIHKKEWIDDILRRADDFNIPVFIKNNAHYPIERKEFPTWH